MMVALLWWLGTTIAVCGICLTIPGHFAMLPALMLLVVPATAVAAALRWLL